jgi:hypothetical protein
MSDISMFITLDPEMNEKFVRLARQNRRSKRMEVMVALDTYLASLAFDPPVAADPIEEEQPA